MFQYTPITNAKDFNKKDLKQNSLQGKLVKKC